MYKTILVQKLGKVTVKVNETSKCKCCNSVIIWGVNSKAQSVPLDYIEGIYLPHKHKKSPYTDLYAEQAKQKRRDTW